MFIDEADRKQLLEEIEEIEKALAAKFDFGAEPEGEPALVLARIVAGMSEEDWDQTVHEHPLISSWMSLPLKNGKEAVLLKLHQKLQALSHASNRDFLSGLYNRRFFYTY